MRNSDRGRSDDRLRVNNRIRVPEVRVVDEAGAQLGVMPTYKAIQLAQDHLLDLVEISPKASPPVCKIVDYGKYKFDLSKKRKGQKGKEVEVKEIKFRPRTEEHDFDFKVKHVRRFLEEGHKVKLVVSFKGREIVHPETGSAMLERVVEALGEACAVEQRPNMEGRLMVMILAPRKTIAKVA